MRPAPTLLLLLAFLPLGGCSLEGFDVTPCQAGETVGFAIAPIKGVFSDYQPRPSDISIRLKDDRSWEEAAVWSASFPYNGPEDEAYESRPAHKLIVYGKPIAGWEATIHPKPLENGLSYAVKISDGGHHGWLDFEMGKPLPACQS